MLVFSVYFYCLTVSQSQVCGGPSFSSILCSFPIPAEPFLPSTPFLFLCVPVCGPLVFMSCLHEPFQTHAWGPLYFSHTWMRMLSAMFPLFRNALLQPSLSCYCAVFCVVDLRFSPSIWLLPMRQEGSSVPPQARAHIAIASFCSFFESDVCWPGLEMGISSLTSSCHALCKTGSIFCRVPVNRCFSMSKSWAGWRAGLERVWLSNRWLYFSFLIRSRHVSCYSYIALFNLFLALKCFNKWKTSFLVLRFGQFNWIFPTVVNLNSSIICFVLCVTGAII